MPLNAGVDLYTGIGSILCGAMLTMIHIMSPGVSRADWFAMLTYSASLSAITQGVYALARAFS